MVSMVVMRLSVGLSGRALLGACLVVTPLAMVIPAMVIPAMVILDIENVVGGNDLEVTR